MEKFDSSSMEQIEMRMIRHSPFEIRGHIDKNNLEFQSLVESIREHGLLQPIIIRPITHGFELVAGYRRLEACRMLHWRFVQCKISDMSDKEAYEIQITENIQRKSLNPLEEAEAFKKYVKDFGWGGVKELAKKIKKSEEFVSHRIQLLNLNAEVRQQIIQKNLSTSQALELIGISQNDQPILMHKVIDDHLTIRQIRKIKSADFPDTKHYERKNGLQKIAKKSTLALKITLSKFDTLIDDINKTQNTKNQKFLILHLMEMRYGIHDMIDKSLKVQKDKKLLDGL